MRLRLETLGRLVWPRSWHRRALIGAIAWSAMSIGVTLSRRPSAPVASLNAPLAEPDSGYVSSAACRACHPAEHASWHASFHRTMTQRLTPANALAPLDGAELSFNGVLHRVERRGETFFVTQRTNGAETAPPRELVLSTGSHHQQNFWVATGAARTLEPFPFAWLIAEKMWVPVGDSFLAPPEIGSTRGEAGAWNNGCLHCHTTHGQSRGLRDGGFDSRVVELGISCGACHGEGREHAARHRNPLRRYLAHFNDAPDPTIANPGKMSGPASALACGQCHSIWAFESAEAESAANRDGFLFRPGDAVLGDRFVAQPASEDHAEQKRKLRAANPHFFTDSYWPDGAVRVTGREYNGVERSPCFKGGKFSCLSCHEMHPDKTDRATLHAWAPSQMRDEAKSDRACLQCHAAIGADISAHTRHAPQSAGSRCYDCHMPHSSFGLMKAVRSHEVTSPTVEESLRHGRPNACNLCHLDRPLAWTAEKLHAWFGQPQPALARDDREIAAGALWLLKGDAGQRGLVAWSMGWTPAQAASGRDWLAPYLAITLNDPYAAVRYAAWKSLRTLPGFENFSYVYTAPDAETFAAASRAYGQAAGQPPREIRAATLIEANGRIRADVYERLLEQRDNRRIYLVE